MLACRNHRADHLVGIEDAVDDRTGAAIEGFLERVFELRDRAHAPAGKAVGLGELHPVRSSVERRLGVVLVIDQRLPLMDHAEDGVVEDDRDDRQVVVLDSCKLDAVHAERAITRDMHDALVGVADLGTDGSAETESHGTEAA